jgi:hypothetical protein
LKTARAISSISGILATKSGVTSVGSKYVFKSAVGSSYSDIIIDKSYESAQSYTVSNAEDIIMDELKIPTHF